MFETQQEPSSEEIFNYLKMFNQVVVSVVSDEELASRLPEAEFEQRYGMKSAMFYHN